MRIISGIYKSRTLKSPLNKNDVRPTTDRARETLFNILSNRLEFEDKKCMDLFCGTGSFGLEFLSRGGYKCTFVDFNIKTVKENIKNLNLKNNYEIIKNDVLKYLSKLEINCFDIAFADPPYKYKYYDKLLENLIRFNLLFILEHDKNLLIPEKFKEKLFLQKKIGISIFSFFDFKQTI